MSDSHNDTLDPNDLIIIRQIAEGRVTPGEILPYTKFGTSDSIRRRARAMEGQGLLKINKRRVRREGGLFGSHPEVMHYTLTETGKNI